MLSKTLSGEPSLVFFAVILGALLTDQDQDPAYDTHEDWQKR